MTFHDMGPLNTLKWIFNILSQPLFNDTGLPLLRYARFVHASGPLHDLFHVWRDILTNSLTQEGLDSNVLGTLVHVSMSFPSIHLFSISLLYFFPCYLLIFFWCHIMHFTYLCCFLWVLLPYISLIRTGVSFPFCSLLFTQYPEQCFSTFFFHCCSPRKIFQTFDFMALLPC